MPRTWLYKFVPIATLTTPREGEVMVDRWWLVHDELGAVFYCPPQSAFAVSPQCNREKRAVEIFQRKDHFNEGFSVRHIATAYVGYWDANYGYTLGGVPDVTSRELTLAD